MWVSMKKWKALEKRVTDIEKQVKNQPHSCIVQNQTKMTMHELVDESFKIPVNGNLKEGREEFCNSVISVIGNMKGTELEPYLSQMTVERNDSSFNITFKIPILPYNETVNLRLKDLYEKSFPQE